MDLQKIIKISLILLIVMCLFAIKKDTIETLLPSTTTDYQASGLLHNNWKGKDPLYSQPIRTALKEIQDEMLDNAGLTEEEKNNIKDRAAVSKAQFENYGISNEEVDKAHYLFVDERYNLPFSSVGKSLMNKDSNNNVLDTIREDQVKDKYVPILLPNVTCTGTAPNETCVLNEPTTIKLRYLHKPFNKVKPQPAEGSNIVGGYCSGVYNCQSGSSSSTEVKYSRCEL